ncbi:MAG: MBL fold metallo-hydrolase [Bacteroidota bacterium]|nr:MBL fold metallo-hydrolase [Bacteroidota bacterium]
MNVSLLVLGSGTSQGVPAIGCRCETCRSADPRDARLRPSVLLRAGDAQLLIDTSSDFRQQMLRHGITRIDAVLYTHHHYDHIGGFDDLRQFNFLQSGPVDVYGLPETLDEIRVTFRYAFGSARQTGGGLPSARMHEVTGGTMFRAGEAEVLPVPVMHGVLPVLGYRVGNIAYITDTNDVPSRSIDMLAGVDILVLDALRHHAHPTHYSLEEAIDVAQRVGARRTLFTHIAHNIQHRRDSALLPDNMEFSYDGQLVTSAEELP